MREMFRSLYTKVSPNLWKLDAGSSLYIRYLNSKMPNFAHFLFFLRFFLPPRLASLAFVEVASLSSPPVEVAAAAFAAAPCSFLGSVKFSFLLKSLVTRAKLIFPCAAWLPSSSSSSP